jgi:hypothetical protein
VRNASERRLAVPGSSFHSTACILFLVLGAGCAACLPTQDISRAEACEVTRTVIRVGPQREFTSIAAAARFARSGTVVEIDAGDYVQDVAVWPQNDLTIRGVGGRVALVAAGASAEQKAIWVVKGDNVLIENIAFFGATVANRNGAGIRHEGGKLVVRNCLFEGNEMGLLTWNNPEAELEIHASEFRANASGNAVGTLGHQIYVGSIRRFTLRSSYVHQGAYGHLVKSRALETHVFYNRLTDEQGGRSSYELEFPNGGVAYVVGNIIQQSAHTENPRMVYFGAEGYKAPRNEIYVVNNTFINELPDGSIPLVVREGASVYAVNNLLLGTSDIDQSVPGIYVANHTAASADVVLLSAYDYRLRSTSALVGTAVAPQDVGDIKLRLDREYVHPLRTRAVTDQPFSPGAIQSLSDAPS